MPWKTNLTDLGKTIVGQSAQLLESSKFVPLNQITTLPNFFARKIILFLLEKNTSIKIIQFFYY
jgi:hypothetical protein